MIVGYAENILLITQKHGVKFRLSPSRFSPYLSKKLAIVLATIQLLIPIGLSLVLDDLVGQLARNLGFFVIPFFLLFGVILYFGEIRSSLPYKITTQEKLVGLVIVTASLVTLTIQSDVFIDTLRQQYGWIPH